jgi:acetoin utilization protein AcuC
VTPRAAVVWTPEFLSYQLSDDHPLDPIRLDLTMRLATDLGVLEGVEPLVPEQAPDEEVQRVHVPSYLTAVKSAPENPFGVGHGLGTEDNPIFIGMHEASALVCGGSLLAAREIAEGRADRAVNIAGGLHHAMRDRAAGFCVYNDCAVAISWLLDHGFDRIAYIDVDVHHGDGVQAAFYTDPRVLTISLHQHPMTLWPGTGWPGEYGKGEAEGSSRSSARRSSSHSAVSTPTSRTRWPTSDSPSTATARSIARCASSPPTPRAASGSRWAAGATGCSGWCHGRGHT